MAWELKFDKVHEAAKQGGYSVAGNNSAEHDFINT